jgi:hypothetical protein
MALTPIRGAPPGAPNPDFPIENPGAKPARPTVPPASADQSPTPPVRQRHTPVEISGGGVTFRFRVIPEQPAIARASMTIHIVQDAVDASAAQTLGFLRMSAATARSFLTDLRNGRSPILAMGDEDGDVQIEYGSTDSEPVLKVRKPGAQEVLHCRTIEKGLDLSATANELLADLGA